MTIKLSTKQLLTLKLLNDPTIVDVLYGGGAGGAKTMTVGIWTAIQCRNYPGIRIGMGRKEITRLKQTTVHTLFNEVHPLLGIKKSEFKYYDQKGIITYINGSEIQLVDLVWMPGDPDFDRFGSLNFTHTIAEEAGEIKQKAKNVFHSRKNRYLNDKYNIVGKSISTCNPSQNFLKNEYYKPYKELGAGEYQKWLHGLVEVSVNGGKVKVDAYRAFIRSLATDNPFLPQNYIEVLRQLPPAERKRLLEGDWDYGDDDLMLFKSSTIDRSLTDRIERAEKYIGVDVSDSGVDETIISLVEGNVLADQVALHIDKTGNIGEQVAMGIIKYAQMNGLDARKARTNIAIDVVGIGASTRDFLKSRGWGVREFIAGAGATTDMFRNLRGETIYNLSQEMENGTFKIYSRLPTMDQLRSQLMAHEYTTEERRILVKQKIKIKEVLGRSPDNAESAYIAFWVSKGNNDPRNNPNRISF